MAFRYKKKKITLNFFKDTRPEKYVAANVLVGSINYNKLCDEVNQRTGIHRGQVAVVLQGAQDTMISFLEEGFSVKLGEFGSFRPAINSTSQDSEEEVKASTVVRRKIIFTPGTQFQEMLNRTGMVLFSELDTDPDAETPPAGEEAADNGGTPDPNV
jgi:predicted histone-like DNA-binding protein